MLKPAKSYEEACRTFRWRIPDRYNIAFDVCDRQTMAGADGHRTALIVETADGSVERHTFHMLRLLSNRLANVLTRAGVMPGDRVVVSFPQSLEAAVAILAVLKLGAVAVPVPVTLGEVPLAWRLADSGASAAVVSAEVGPRLVSAREAAPSLSVMVVADRAPQGCTELWTALEGASDIFAPLVTSAEDAALLFYPEHACGKPAGVLHAHRSLPGNLPPVEMALGFFPQSGDILWSAADWMGFHGLMWALLPAWHHGVPVVAGPFGQSAEDQLAVMGRHGVRAIYAPPLQLSALAQAALDAPHPLPRALATGPAALTEPEQALALRAFGVPAHEIWGSVESGAVAANNSSLMEQLANSPGRAAPGVTVDAVDGNGRPLRAGERGMLAVAPGAPGTFVAHWNATDPSRTRLTSGWLMTGLVGTRDLDGYLWPDPQALPQGCVVMDGFTVALDEVTAALSRHPKVAAAAVLEIKPGEIKAFVVPAAGVAGDVTLARELQDFVTTRRAAHEVPRRVEFVADLPHAEDGSVAHDQLLSMPVRLDAPSRDERW
ncbi:acyl-CoA synthetase [Magnetospirillum aberrantis]|uniref:AMP-binding protein n=1 Tax=Magnetospirillum aberrantis SpK TaxID=908842 RepID=A0A7C9QV63_9PROT|nr:AMP-binding protein [Magnetospirillum aberrantis]NFV81197.1 AMP-binding protein [Magnetospirillum aberrantis SpK]